MDLVVMIYGMTAKLPAMEQFGLITQMRRCAVSIPSNVAEGWGRQATGEYRHHLSFARGSLLELETQLLLCQRLSYLSADEADLMLKETGELSKML
ncbi:MAG TPA: four helix bundle protein, partial [Candidatus Binatia bacterium]|nr:four helix bundle protein [Candidatus Binatia bacterium]